MISLREEITWLVPIKNSRGPHHKLSNWLRMIVQSKSDLDRFILYPPYMDMLSLERLTTIRIHRAVSHHIEESMLKGFLLVEPEY